eukprot:m.12855 g.12855  ORF g.12855 m.12855 type:complete len:307 (+) comp7350_c0_seq1:76-996(+)
MSTTEKLWTLYRKAQKKASPSLILKYGLKLGRRLRKEEEHGDGIDVLGAVLLVVTNAHGEEHPDVATVMVSLGDLFEAKGDFSRAVSYFGKAFPIQVEKLGIDHSDTTKTSLKLAAIEMHQQEYFEKALIAFKRAYELKLQNVGKEHPATASALINIGLVHKQCEDFSRAVEALAQALAIRIKVLGEDHQETADIITHLADVYRLEGDYVKALEYYEWAVSIREKHASSSKTQSQLAGDCLFNMALIYRRLEKHTVSAKMFTRAAHHITQSQGDKSVDAKDCLDQAKRAHELAALSDSTDEAETAI